MLLAWLVVAWPAGALEAFAAVCGGGGKRSLYDVLLAEARQQRERGGGQAPGVAVVKQQEAGGWDAAVAGTVWGEVGLLQCGVGKGAVGVEVGEGCRWPT